MSKVVVVLDGGLVQEVYSDDPTVEVAVLDNDSFEDVDPRLDLDNFFRPQLDPELAVLKEWRDVKEAFLLASSSRAGD